MESGKKEAIELILFRSTIEEWNLHKTDSLSLCVELEKQKSKAIVCVCVCVFNVTIIIACLPSSVCGLCERRHVCKHWLGRV